MSQAPKPEITRILAAGVALGIVGVVLFVMLWVILGQAEVEMVVRLLISLCLPPALIAAALGAYILIARSGSA